MSNSGEAVASLASLPTEIADTIYHSLSPGALARLARVSKEIYAAVQGPLYRRPILNSYKRLQQFVLCLNRVAHWDKTGNARSKRVVHLTLLIDPAREEMTTGRPLIAVLLARLIKAIARYNPNITITLVISHSACDSQPVRSFASEQFPRVTSLVLDLGNDPVGQPSAASNGSGSSSSINSVIPSRRARLESRDIYNFNSDRSKCVPNREFWTRFFNGISFPDLQRLELHHRSRTQPSYGDYQSWESHPMLFTEIDTTGLARIERLVVNSVPEFNDVVLMAGLKHAPLLTDLHVEDCHVTYAALDKLLLHALPVLKKLVLKIHPRSRHPLQARDQMNLRVRPDDYPHLCAHFRRSGRNLKHFEFTAPYICREIFIDEFEKAKLRESGHPGSLSGDPSGNISSGELDATLITAILKNVRQYRDTDTNVHRTVESNSLEEDRKMMDRERMLRNRRVMIEKERWTRRIHVYEGMCIDGECFDELPVLAEMEEQGVAWSIGHKPGNSATWVRNGISQNLSYTEEFERELPRMRRPQTLEYDTNDDLSGQ